VLTSAWRDEAIADFRKRYAELLDLTDLDHFAKKDILDRVSSDYEGALYLGYGIGFMEGKKRT